MQTKYKLAVRLIAVVIAMGTQFAYADDDSKKGSFKDGIKSSIAFDDDHKKFNSSSKEHEFENESEHETSWKEFEDHSHVTMVPEPATDAMLLGGLAVLLVAARRRKVTKSL
jgi:hypothetical protein